MVVVVEAAETFSGWAGIDHGKPASWNNPTPSSSWQPEAGEIGYSASQLYLIGGFDGDDKKVLDGVATDFGLPLNPAHYIIGTPVQNVETAYMRWRGRLKPGFVADNLMSFSDSGLVARITVNVDATGLLTVTNNAGVTVATTGQMFEDIDVRIEFMSRIVAAPNGEWELRVNGVTVGSASGVNCGNGLMPYLFFRQNAFHQVGDVVWGHGTGPIADSICTWIETPTIAGRVVRLRVAGLGLHNDWSTVAGTNVSSVPITDRVAIMTGPEVGTHIPAPFDDSPGIASVDASEGNARENFRMVSLPAFDGLDDGSLAIKTVIQAFDLTSDGGGGSENPITYECLINGSIYSNPLGNVGLDNALLAPAWRFLPWNDDPDTAAPWTRAGLNSARWGVRRVVGVVDDIWLWHQEITVVLGGVLPECGGPTGGVNPGAPAEAGPCDVKADSVFTDASFIYDGRNIKHGEPVTESELLIFDVGNGLDSGDTVGLSASEAGTFEASDVGHKFKLIGSDGASVGVLVTAFTSTDLVEGTLDGAVPASLLATETLDWENQLDEIPIPWLEGEQVNVLGDGIPRYLTPGNSPTKFSVSAGIVDLGAFYGVIVAGLPKIADMELLDADAEGVEPLRDKKKLPAKAGMLVEFTRDFSIGDGESPVDLAHYDTNPITEYPNENPLNLPTKTVVVNVPTRWGIDGRVLVRQVEPLPISVLAIIPVTALGGRTSV